MQLHLTATATVTTMIKPRKKPSGPQPCDIPNCHSGVTCGCCKQYQKPNLPHYSDEQQCYCQNCGTTEDRTLCKLSH